MDPDDGLSPAAGPIEFRRFRAAPRPTASASSQAIQTRPAFSTRSKAPAGGGVAPDDRADARIAQAIELAGSPTAQVRSRRLLRPARRRRSKIGSNQARLRSQLHRVVVPRVGEAEAHEHVRRQFLADGRAPGHPAVSPRAAGRSRAARSRGPPGAIAGLSPKPNRPSSASVSPSDDRPASGWPGARSHAAEKASAARIRARPPPGRSIAGGTPGPRGPGARPARDKSPGRLRRDRGRYSGRRPARGSLARRLGCRRPSRASAVPPRTQSSDPAPRQPPRPAEVVDPDPSQQGQAEGQPEREPPVVGHVEDGTRPEQVVDRRNPEAGHARRRSRIPTRNDTRGDRRRASERQGRQPDEGRQPGISARRLVQVVDAQRPGQVGMPPPLAPVGIRQAPCRPRRALAAGRSTHHGGVSRRRSPQTGLRER